MRSVEWFFCILWCLYEGFRDARWTADSCTTSHSSAWWSTTIFIIVAILLEPYLCSPAVALDITSDQSVAVFVTWVPVSPVKSLVMSQLIISCDCKFEKYIPRRYLNFADLVCKRFVAERCCCGNLADVCFLSVCNSVTCLSCQMVTYRPLSV